jgi:hypothetical protein
MNFSFGLHPQMLADIAGHTPIVAMALVAIALVVYLIKKEK